MADATTTCTHEAAVDRRLADVSQSHAPDPRPDAIVRRQPARAVTELVHRHAQIVEQRHVKIRQRRVLEPHVPSALDRAGAAAGEHQRNVVAASGVLLSAIP